MSFHSSKFLLSTYAFHLPEDRIAQIAVHPPETAKMLVFERATETYQDRTFQNLPEMAGSDRLFVWNDTRVIPCRVPFESAEFTNRSGFRRKKAGEIFFLKKDTRDSHHSLFEALVFPGSAFSLGSTVTIDHFVLEVVSKIPDGRILKILSGQTINEFLQTKGKIPLPPYVEYSDEKARDYQTDFACKEGSLAAPTASLHFTERLMCQLRENGAKTRFLTLHVGLGTFKPVKTHDIREHSMHAENFEIPLSIFRDVAEAKSEGRKIVWIGTTVTRTLESLPCLWPHVRDRFSNEPITRDFWNSVSTEDSPVTFFSADSSTAYGSTAIFLYPGKSFRIIDEIITNFHLPESTLFMLVSAFIGIEKAHEIYTHALSSTYRFYSFGDGMWLK